MCEKTAWALLTDNLTRGPLTLTSGVSDEGKALIWAKDKLGRPCLALSAAGEQPDWAWANWGWADTPANRRRLQAEIDAHNGKPATEEVAATSSATKAEALTLVQCLIDDFEALKSGAWVPDDDSCDASIEVSERIQAFLEALPCDS